MPKLAASCCALASFFIHHVQSNPISTTSAPAISTEHAPGLVDWQKTLSNDTLHRLDVAREHLDDESFPAQAFRNDTIMRINIEREALDHSLIDLSQAFGMTLPASRVAVTAVGINKRSSAEDFREQVYTRGGAMAYPKAIEQRSNAEDFREQVYTRGGAMAYPKTVEQRSNAEDFREQVYTRGGAMAYPKVIEQRSDTPYSSLLNRDNLALGAVERINIAHRVLGKAELTMEEAKEMGSHGDEYLSEYWHTSMNYGGFWTTDQAAGKPNFVQGGQANGFGFTQSSFHKLHCLANLRMMLAWHIAGNGDKMTRDMNAHTIHCLEYIRGRELESPDLNEEPIDTVDYKGMGIH